MPVTPSKALLMSAAALLLAGCNATTGDHVAAGKPGGTQALAMAQAGDVTGSIDKNTDKAKAAEARSAPFLPGDELAAGGGNSAADAVAEGRAAYRANHFREAEGHFRRATQLAPRNSEAWLGLAASSDRLHDFAQADRAYGKAREIAGPSAEVLNNQGYSYMLRGDLKRARDTLNAARRLDPNNKYVENNLTLLAASENKAARR